MPTSGAQSQTTEKKEKPAEYHNAQRIIKKLVKELDIPETRKKPATPQKLAKVPNPVKPVTGTSWSRLIVPSEAKLDQGVVPSSPRSVPYVCLESPQKGFEPPSALSVRRSSQSGPQISSSQGHAKSKDESSVSNTEKEVPRWEIVPQKTAKFKPNFYKRNTRRTTVRRDPEDDSSYPLASNEGETGLPLTDKDLQIPYAQLNDAQCRHHARVLVHESRRMCQNFREGSCGWQSSLFSYCPECYMEYPEIPPGMKAYLYTFDPKDPQETDWYGIRPTPEELLAKKNFQPSPRTYRTPPRSLRSPALGRKPCHQRSP